MANKLIQDLGAGAVLVTDLLEHQPIAGPPSLKGTVTQLFSDAGGALAIDRDNRELVDGGGTANLNWNNSQLLAFGFVTLDWSARTFIDSSAVIALSWEDRDASDLAGITAIDWEGRELVDSGTNASLSWENRQLIGPDGTTVVLDWNSNTPIDTTQRVFNTPTDPNGVVTATKPALCYGDDGSLWCKDTAGPDNTGWIVLITA